MGLGIFKLKNSVRCWDSLQIFWVAQLPNPPWKATLQRDNRHINQIALKYPNSRKCCEYVGLPHSNNCLCISRLKGSKENGSYPFSDLSELDTAFELLFRILRRHHQNFDSTMATSPSCKGKGRHSLQPFDLWFHSQYSPRRVSLSCAHIDELQFSSNFYSLDLFLTVISQEYFDHR